MDQEDFMFQVMDKTSVIIGESENKTQKPANHLKDNKKLS